MKENVTQTHGGASLIVFCQHLKSVTEITEKFQAVHAQYLLAGSIITVGLIGSSHNLEYNLLMSLREATCWTVAIVVSSNLIEID